VVLWYCGRSNEIFDVGPSLVDNIKRVQRVVYSAKPQPHSWLCRRTWFVIFMYPPSHIICKHYIYKKKKTFLTLSSNTLLHIFNLITKSILLVGTYCVLFTVYKNRLTHRSTSYMYLLTYC